MKTIKTFAQISAIALAGTITFAACSSDDDKVQNINPTYDGKSVKTQFAINVPVAHKTRQGVDIVQGQTTPVFRGMQDVKLFSATAAPTDATTQNEILIATEIPKEGSGTLETTTNHKVYSDVVVPINTSNFLFYGQATIGSNTDAANGSLTMSSNAGSSLGDISFDLEKIRTSGVPSGTGTCGEKLLKILNTIAQTETWKNSTNVGLQTAYTEFTTTTISGSAQSILKTVERLYNNINSNNGAESLIVDAINNNITAAFTVTGNAPSATLSYNTDVTTAFPNIASFPEDINLPQGAARLTYAEGSKSFSYVTDNSVIGSSAINPTTICYPAALYYFANSELGASDNAAITWPTNFNDWESYFDDWNNAVKPTTRTIALKNRINYGVALLKTTVKTNSPLADNSQSLGGLANNKNISISGSSKFTLTGVLIGGQPAAAKWDFTPKSTDPAEYNYTIWDSQMAGNLDDNDATTMDVSTTACAPNYTMVLDNYNETPQTVNIAIELMNNVGDFYGVDGLVPNGSKFYLVGQLNPTAGNSTVSDPGSSGLTRVFAQDYTTTANLTITSLKNAYMTIPDLRSTQLKLGLSVDLEWKAGLTFDVTIN